MNFAVIMAGGQGERLWPLSTRKRPKQFLNLLGKRTMLQETVERIAPLIPIENTIVVVAEQYVPLVLRQLPSLPAKNIVAEPMARGTALCVGVAALWLSRPDPEGTMVVLPADHVITNNVLFLQCLREAIAAASAGDCLITLGIAPDHPATGYGYIRAVKEPAASNGVMKVEEFTEKPDQGTATRFLRQGDYFWNSGMFVWRVDTILYEIKLHMPKLYAGLQVIKGHLGAVDGQAVLNQVYHDQTAISIDYGVMEKSKCVQMIPTGNIGWSDVGDWAALERVLRKDECGNSIRASHLGIDTQDSIIVSEEGKLIATLGVSNLVIVDTGEALLVMDKSRSQEVKRIVQMQKKEDRCGP
jgi:mannose-1-phosphate guanylyltransferase